MGWDIALDGVFAPYRVFPLITRSGSNAQGKSVHYYFNYADAPSSIAYPHPAGRELLMDTEVRKDQVLPIDRWGVLIVEEG